MKKINFAEDWEHNKLPQLQTLHYKAVKLKKAIQSQDAYGTGQRELEVEFYDWFNLLDEQLSELMDGGIFDVLAGRLDAIRRVSSLIAALPGHQEMFSRCLGRLMKVLDSPN